MRTANNSFPWLFLIPLFYFHCRWWSMWLQLSSSAGRRWVWSWVSCIQPVVLLFAAHTRLASSLFLVSSRIARPQKCNWLTKCSCYHVINCFSLVFNYLISIVFLFCSGSYFHCHILNMLVSNINYSWLCQGVVRTFYYNCEVFTYTSTRRVNEAN